MEMRLFRVPIRNWKKCVYEAALFESRPEFHAARLIDNDASVRWWIRNDPVQFKIATPAGYFEPDFIYEAQIAGAKLMRVLASPLTTRLSARSSR